MPALRISKTRQFSIRPGTLSLHLISEEKKGVQIAPLFGDGSRWLPLWIGWRGHLISNVSRWQMVQRAPFALKMRLFALRRAPRRLLQRKASPRGFGFIAEIVWITSIPCFLVFLWKEWTEETLVCERMEGRRSAQFTDRSAEPILLSFGLEAGRRRLCRSLR